MTRPGDPAAAGAVVDVELPTTAGSLAVTNLQAQIDGQQRQAVAGELDVGGQAALIELVALRGHVLGSIADYEWAQARAEQLTRDRPADGAALIARARTRSIFHRFTDALADLADARRRGADSATVDTERAAIFQAVGRYDDALTIMSEAEKRRADFAAVAALASLYAESGDIDRAEHLFDESLDRYRGVSPIPLAQLHFQRAKMWLAQGNLPRGRSWLGAAHSPPSRLRSGAGPSCRSRGGARRDRLRDRPAAPADDLLRRPRLPGTARPHPDRGRPCGRGP